MHVPPAYPLTFNFKLMAFASQFHVRDALGKHVGYVKQKLFKLKEAITVFADETQKDMRYTIAADRVIDFSARYRFADGQGQPLGSVKRHGMRSLWRVRLDVLDNDGEVVFNISEESVMVRLLDNLFSEIPVIGMLSGYIFHPAYQATRPDGTVVMRLAKQAALFEGKFALEQISAVTPVEQEQLMLSLMMTTLLERNAG